MSDSESSGVSRRTVLQGALAPLAAWMPVAAVAGEEPRALAAWLWVSFPDPRAARSFGAMCSQSCGEEKSAEALAAALFGCGPSEILSRRAYERGLRRIGASRARDFRDGDLVLVRGWALARTEAELLALYALGRGG